MTEQPRPAPTLSANQVESVASATRDMYSELFGRLVITNVSAPFPHTNDLGKPVTCFSLTATNEGTGNASADGTGTMTPPSGVIGYETILYSNLPSSHVGAFDQLAPGATALIPTCFEIKEPGLHRFKWTAMTAQPVDWEASF